MIKIIKKMLIYFHLQYRLAGKGIEKVGDAAEYEWSVLKECVRECVPSISLNLITNY